MEIVLTGVGVVDSENECIDQEPSYSKEQWHAEDSTRKLDPVVIDGLRELPLAERWIVEQARVVEARVHCFRVDLRLSSYVWLSGVSGVASSCMCISFSNICFLFNRSPLLVVNLCLSSLFKLIHCKSLSFFLNLKEVLISLLMSLPAWWNFLVLILRTEPLLP